jgi:DGQHR domain-containing protein
MKKLRIPRRTTGASTKTGKTKALGKNGEAKGEKPRSPKRLSFPCLSVEQGSTKLALFRMSAKQLWTITAINKRDPDKDKGYQRVLSAGRVDAIARYVQKGNALPTSILVTFDDAKLNEDGTELTIPNTPEAGWIIDGQHRLAGIHKADIDMEVSVVAFLGLPIQQQVEQFIRVNREAKNVPSSLYIDLLKYIPDKSDADLARERAADIADSLRKDDDSPFSGKIAMIGSPKAGQISLANFARKIAPLVQKHRGKLQIYSATAQIGIIKNYYKALAHVFPDIYDPKEGVSVFFKTVGFGGLMTALPTVFDLCMRDHNGFRVEDLVKTLKRVDDFNFEEWDELGTGNEAEKTAGDNLTVALLERYQAGDAERGLDIPL